MDAAISQKSPARLAELDPFVVTGVVETPQAQPRGKAARGRCDDRTYADAEYGCVDWYQYRDQADDEHTTH
jgi:hypothetical protein